MNRLAVLPLVMLLVAGCVDHGACLRSHQQTILMPMIVGKITVMMPQNITVCDEWEFPDGRPDAIRAGGQ